MPIPSTSKFAKELEEEEKLEEKEEKELAEELAGLDYDVTPKKRGPGRPKGSPNRSTTSKSGTVLSETTIREGLMMIGRVWAVRESIDKDHPQDPNCGEIFMTQVPDIASSLFQLSRTNKTVKRWLESMMTGGGWAGVAFAVYPVAIAIRDNHMMPALRARRQAAAEMQEQMFGTQPNPNGG
jgi:hypothetical protein